MSMVRSGATGTRRLTETATALLAEDWARVDKQMPHFLGKKATRGGRY